MFKRLRSIRTNRYRSGSMGVAMSSLWRLKGASYYIGQFLRDMEVDIFSFQLLRYSQVYPTRSRRGRPGRCGPEWPGRRAGASD